MSNQWRLRFIQFVLGGGGFLSLIAGALLTYRTQYENPQYRYLPADQEWRDHLKQVIEVSRQRVEQASSSPLLVDVAGAVAKPGVYSLSSGARIQEAILAAGGFSTKADQQYIHQELNLADTLRDRGKIYVPSVGETAKSEVSTNRSESEVNVNSASAELLQTLPGIGAKRAGDIMANRPYQNAAELQEKAGINTTILTDIERAGYLLSY